VGHGLSSSSWSHCLSLAGLGISLLHPLPVGTVSTLKRLDLSFNYLHDVPTLRSNNFPYLRELWLRGNPLTELPDISSLTQLEVLDVRDTLITSLPPFISMLKRLHILDWRGTPMSEQLRARQVPDNDLPSLLQLLSRQHDRLAAEEHLKTSIEAFYLQRGIHDADIRLALQSLLPGLKVSNLNMLVMHMTHVSSVLCLRRLRTCPCRT